MTVALSFLKIKQFQYLVLFISRSLLLYGGVQQLENIQMFEKGFQYLF